MAIAVSKINFRLQKIIDQKILRTIRKYLYLLYYKLPDVKCHMYAVLPKLKNQKSFNLNY